MPVARFTPHEDAILIESFPRVKVSRLVELLPRHSTARIANRARYLGLQKPPELRGKAALHVDIPPSAFASLSERDRGYVAGLLDGEGMFSFVPSSDSGRAYNASVEISNCWLPVIEWLHEKLGGKTGPLDKVGNRRQPYCWWLSCNIPVIGFARDIAPYLIVKREQAELIGAGWSHLDDSERFEVYARIRELKHLEFPHHSISG